MKFREVFHCGHHLSALKLTQCAEWHHLSGPRLRRFQYNFVVSAVSARVPQASSAVMLKGLNVFTASLAQRARTYFTCETCAS